MKKVFLGATVGLVTGAMGVGTIAYSATKNEVFAVVAAFVAIAILSAFWTHLLIKDNS